MDFYEGDLDNFLGDENDIFEPEFEDKMERFEDGSHFEEPNKDLYSNI